MCIRDSAKVIKIPERSSQSKTETYKIEPPFCFKRSVRKRDLINSIIIQSNRFNITSSITTVNVLFTIQIF